LSNTGAASTTASAATIANRDSHNASPATGRSPFLLQVPLVPRQANAGAAVCPASRKRQRGPLPPETKRPSLFHRPWEAYPTELEKNYCRSSAKQGHAGRRHHKSARHAYDPRK
jgi:hypothetical protein